jgi:hypothetical protein
VSVWRLSVSACDISELRGTVEVPKHRARAGVLEARGRPVVPVVPVPVTHVKPFGKSRTASTNFPLFEISYELSGAAGAATVLNPVLGPNRTVVGNARPVFKRLLLLPPPSVLSPPSAILVPPDAFPVRPSSRSGLW